MRCEVVREALSAVLDGEPQYVPSQQLDVHLTSCRSCRSWLVGAAAQARRLSSAEVAAAPDLAVQILTAAGTAPTAGAPGTHGRLAGRAAVFRAALIVVGVFQVVVALVQIAGVDFGMVSVHGHGAATGAHLLHESTAWLLALGGAMIAAGIWTAAAPGVATIVGVFALALLGYVAADAYTGQVTTARVISHMPLLVGLVFAVLVARERAGSPKSGAVDALTDSQADSALPADADRGRRRTHLRPVSDATRRFTPRFTPHLSWMIVAGVDRGRDDQAVTALALAAASGNPAALEAFIKATQHDVWRFVAYLCDGASADDLTQETFLRAIGGIAQFSGRSSARTWLLAIARRVVADHIRYLRSRPRAAHGADPEQVLNRDRPERGFEDLVEVTTMIAGLSVEQREALLLTQLLGLSYHDAAAVCDCPVGTIRSRVARARSALLDNPGRDDLTG